MGLFNFSRKDKEKSVMNPEQIKEKIQQQLPFEAFKKMMLDIVDKTPEKD